MNQVRNLNTACQIFIGSLSPTVIESDLYSLTVQFGQIVHIRILRNIYTKEPMGLAFVSFSEPAAAQRARAELNGILFKGRHINVTLFYKPRNPSANIFVNSLPVETTAKDLDQIFKQFGPIVSTKVSYDPSLKSNCYGYVQFEKEEHAELALNSKDQIWASAKIQVSKFLPIKVRHDPQLNPNLYVRGFDGTLTEEALGRIFKAFGRICSHVIMRAGDNNGGDRHFGYVCFEHAESAQKAVNSLNGQTVDGVTWYVAPHLKREVRKRILEEEFKKKKEAWKKRNLFIKNLPQHMTENMLNQLCVEYGTIESVKIHMAENITYQDGVKVPELISNGSAFVCFATEESARRAILGLKNKMIDGKNIYVSMWKPREELVKSLNARKFRMINRQMNEIGIFSPMYPQQMKPSRGRGIGGPQGMPPMMQQMMPPMMPQMMPRQAMPERETIKLNFDIHAFNSASPEAQRRILGEQLYPIVLKNSNEKVAGKITGMLLEIESRVLLNLIQNPAEISSKVREAIEVLRKAWAGNPDLLSQLA